MEPPRADIKHIQLAKHFDVLPKGEYKMERTRCKACGSVFANVSTRKREHLIACQQWLSLNPVSSSKPQGTLKFTEFNRVSPQRQQAFGRLLAKWVYNHNLPFHIVDSEEFRDMVYELSPGMRVPGSDDLRDRLLNETYAETRESVRLALQNETEYTLTSDEAVNTARVRMLNLSVCTRQGAFIMKTESVLNGQALNAEYTTHFILTGIKEIEALAPRLKLNAIALDTCNTQLAVLNQIKRQYSTADRVPIAILCEAYSLQLLVEDLLTSDDLLIIKTTFEACSTIVNTIARSHKQLLRLKSI
jgi:hypothetical protein